MESSKTQMKKNKIKWKKKKYLKEIKNKILFKQNKLIQNNNFLKIQIV